MQADLCAAVLALWIGTTVLLLGAMFDVKERRFCPVCRSLSPRYRRWVFGGMTIIACYLLRERHIAGTGIEEKS